MSRPLDFLRVVLGVVLVVTALDFFLPHLMPFVPDARWHDPMALRLMTNFERSGLLAVAKFIHLAAGLLLLVNRTVPFALAALLPVNICGAFLSLFIEGSALIGLLALLTVALNGVLMLAYLPYYRGVLDPGQRADGEGAADGEYYESLFANPLSSAPARAYPAAALVLLAAMAFYWFVVPYSNGTTGVITLAIPAVLLTIGAIRAVGRGQAV